MTQRPAGKLGFGIAALAIFLLFAAAPVVPLHARSDSAGWEKAAGGTMSFEVASVKRDTSDAGTASMNIPLLGDAYVPQGGLLSGTNIPLVSYIYFAYKLTGTELQILAPQLPGWVRTSRYDIEARAQVGSNPTKDQMRLMMQSLLADRFKLRIHYETRQMPLYALVLIKPGSFGTQLRPHSDATPCSTVPSSPPETIEGGFPIVCNSIVGFPTAAGHLRVGARNVSIDTLANSLMQMANLDRPVVAGTGLSGTFDFIFEWPSQSRVVIADLQSEDTGPTFLECLHDQLGLKLQATTGPVQAFVVDHIEEPSAN
jgi:uncharacterized protein (TIGR03435 family)